MALGFATTLRTARGQKIIDAVDAGSGAGKLRIYSGVRPATGGTATTQLAEITLNDPSFTVASGVLTLSVSPTLTATAGATGTASWARIVDSSNTFVMDLSVGTSGADINLATTSIVENATVQITSGTITEGNA